MKRFDYVVLRVWDENDTVAKGAIKLEENSTSYTQGELKQKLVRWCASNGMPNGNYVIAYRDYPNIWCMDDIYFVKK